MTITIEPLGGLGNQLFVYGLGLSLAESLGTDLQADLWRFRDYPWHIYELDTFENRITCTYSSKARERFGHHWRIIPQTVARCGLYRLSPWSRLLTERYTHYDSALLGAKNGSRLSGYFQCWRYIESVAELIRHGLRRPLNLSSWYRQTSLQLSKAGDWTAVHVRLGNYTSLEKMGVVSSSYYTRSLELVRRLHGPLPVVVFSDQPERAKQMSCFQDGQFQFIESPSNVRAIDSLLLMSQATAKIIGNSTFSWWAAFLEDKPTNTVVAPRPWLASYTFNERDLFPPHWYTIGQ